MCSSDLPILNKHAIGRHARHSAATPAAISGENVGDVMQMSDERLQRWLQRSEEMFQASVGQSDLRMAVESVRSGLRAEVEWRRRAESRAEQAAANENLPPNKRPVTVEFLDSCVREAKAQAAQQGWRCPTCRRPYEVPAGDDSGGNSGNQ